MSDYINCPVCTDAVVAPLDAGAQAAWLRENAKRLVQIADEMEAGRFDPLIMDYMCGSEHAWSQPDASAR